MVDFTLFELHFEDSDLTANAPYSHGEKDVVSSEEPVEDDSSGKGKGKIFGLLVGLVFSVAVAYMARNKVLGDDSEMGEGEEEENRSRIPLRA